LSLLLVFRTNSAYARVYDARCIWGQLTNTIREMGRSTHTNMDGLDREHALMLTAALPTIMLNHLQTQDDKYRTEAWSPQQKQVLTGLLSEHDFKCIWAARNRPMAREFSCIYLYISLSRSLSLSLYTCVRMYVCTYLYACIHV